MWRISYTDGNSRGIYLVPNTCTKEQAIAEFFASHPSAIISGEVIIVTTITC